MLYYIQDWNAGSGRWVTRPDTFDTAMEAIIVRDQECAGFENDGVSHGCRVVDAHASIIEVQP